MIGKFLAQAALDTLEVAAWSGIPATGVTGFLALLEIDSSLEAILAPFIAAGLNVLGFFVKRFLEYYTGRIELPTGII